VGVTSAITNEYNVIAHEIGHNFGSIHDCDSSDSCSTSCAADGSSDAGSSCECCACSGSSCDCNNNFLMGRLDQGQFKFSTCTSAMICTKNPTLGRCLLGNSLLLLFLSYTFLLSFLDFLFKF